MENFEDIVAKNEIATPIIPPIEEIKKVENVIDPPRIYERDNSTSINEKGTAIAETLAIKKATEDNAFLDDIAKEKKEQIKDSVVANKKIMSVKREAEMITSQTEKDNAVFIHWKSVLQFGGIKECHTKSFLYIMIGIIFPVYLLTCLFIKLPFAILNTLLEVINDTFENIKKFSKQAMYISIFLIGILALVVILYIIYFFLVKYNVIVPFF